MKSILFLMLAIIPMLMIATTLNVYAGDDIYDAFRNISEEEREIWFSDRERPAINPDFAPDEDCNIAYELKCIPGSQQSCFDLEGFNNGDNNVCTPIACQEGYHDEYEDETGLCYPNEVECPDTMVLESGGKYGDSCTPLYIVCDEPEHINQDYCREWNKDE